MITNFDLCHKICSNGRVKTLLAAVAGDGSVNVPLGVQDKGVAQIFCIVQYIWTMNSPFMFLKWKNMTWKMTLICDDFCYNFGARISELDINKMAYTAKDPHPPPRHFLYLTETKSWRCEEKDKDKGNENVHLLTHAPTRGMGKQTLDFARLTWRDMNHPGWHGSSCRSQRTQRTCQDYSLCAPQCRWGLWRSHPITQRCHPTRDRRMLKELFDKMHYKKVTLISILNLRHINVLKGFSLCIIYTEKVKQSFLEQDLQMKHYKDYQNCGGLWPHCSSSCGGHGGPLGPLQSVGY